MDETLLPQRFRDWFAERGWQPRAHQLALLQLARADRSSLLVAPTGAGKTLAGFLPSLVDLERARNRACLHTLYISPLKALAVDVERNLQIPCAQMHLGLRIETRTGDTPTSKRQRQRRDPPDILLTTPEQLALLLASADAEHLFATLRRIVLDELHALVTSKRGDLLSLGLARLRQLAPHMVATGLSATVRAPQDLCQYLSDPPAALIEARAGAAPNLRILDTKEYLPWSGHSARHAMGEVYEAIKAHRMTLVFVNTRAQAEATFQNIWTINDDNLPIALHHGSLDAGQRRRVEAAMVAGRLKAVVCTSTLDLGIDWGDVDLVIHVGAPKGASRLLQRIGRANHRLDEPSQALLVPANRFEVLECRAAIDAALAGDQDTPVARQGGLDVLAQHILGTACARPFDADTLYREVTSAAPYQNLTRKDFDDVLAFVATGGYALHSYERFAKIRQRKDGLWRISHPDVAAAHRMNVGTIVEADRIRVRLQHGDDRGGKRYTGPLRRAGRVLGEVEEYFIETLTPGDSFLFGGEIVALRGIVENEAMVTRSQDDKPKIPSYAGGKFPLSTHLAARLRHMLAQSEEWSNLPPQVREWLEIQRQRSLLPKEKELLVETFPEGNLFYLIAYPFEGRLAHQSLGMLLTRRMERLGLQPLGFVANDYALALWGRLDIGSRLQAQEISLDDLFRQDMLGDDLEEWLRESVLMKRTFRNCCVIAGLIQRRFPGKEKTGRQVTISTDLIFDVLHQHEPDHVLLRAAWAEAATGLLDIARLGDMLARIEGHIRHQALDRVSPLAVPVLLEIGREPIIGAGQEAILQQASDDLIRSAGLTPAKAPG